MVRAKSINIWKSGDIVCTRASNTKGTLLIDRKEGNFYRFHIHWPGGHHVWKLDLGTMNTDFYLIKRSNMAEVLYA